MTSPDPDLASHLQRQYFYYFLRRVFAHLHPGEPFLEAPHVEAMCFALQEVAEALVRNLLITLPPRYLKSETVSVAFTAWILGHHPEKKILVASYGQELAAKLARDFRRVVESEWYQRLFPAMRIDERRNTALEVETTRRGCRKAISPGGAVTGFGADITIVDDLAKAEDAQSESARRAVRSSTARLSTRG